LFSPIESNLKKTRFAPLQTLPFIHARFQINLVNFTACTTYEVMQTVVKKVLQRMFMPAHIIYVGRLCSLSTLIMRHPVVGRIIVLESAARLLSRSQNAEETNAAVEWDDGRQQLFSDACFASVSCAFGSL
jgi:hypothetical protein